MLVMLKPSWQGSFRRCVRDDSGAIIKTIEFHHGQPVELEGADLDAVRDDIGKALVEVSIDDKSRPRPTPEPVPEPPQPEPEQGRRGRRSKPKPEPEQGRRGRRKSEESEEPPVEIV